MHYRLLTLCVPENEALVRAGPAFWAEESGHDYTLECFHRREDLLYHLRGEACDAVVVWLSGALGMESAIGVREISQSVPLVWVSEDEVFALASYRLRATAFLRAPASPLQLAGVLARCLEPELQLSNKNWRGN